MLGFGKKRGFIFGRMDDTCDYAVDAAAKMADEPLFVRGKADGSDFNAMGLYIIGGEELWLNVNAVLKRKRELEWESNAEKKKQHLLNLVAYMPIEDRFVDSKTNQEYFVYKLDDSSKVMFTPEEIVKVRMADAEKKSGKVEIREYDELEDVARRNDCIVLKGSKDDDCAVGVWVTSRGDLAKYTIGDVKNKRIELGLESEADSEFFN